MTGSSGVTARPRGGPDAVPLAWLRQAALAVLRRPSLWPVALRQAAVLAAPGWWRRPPFLPLPARDYLRFRLQTAYGGGGDRGPSPDDLVTWLRWCADARRWGARPGG